MATVLNVKATNCFLNYKKCILSHCRTTKNTKYKGWFHIQDFLCFLVIIAWKHTVTEETTLSNNDTNVFK